MASRATMWVRPSPRRCRAAPSRRRGRTTRGEGGGQPRGVDVLRRDAVDAVGAIALLFAGERPQQDFRLGLNDAERQPVLDVERNFRLAGLDIDGDELLLAARIFGLRRHIIRRNRVARPQHHHALCVLDAVVDRKDVIAAGCEPLLVAPDRQPRLFKQRLQRLRVRHILAGIGDKNIGFPSHPPAPLLRHPKCAPI